MSVIWCTKLLEEDLPRSLKPIPACVFLVKGRCGCTCCRPNPSPSCVGSCLNNVSQRFKFKECVHELSERDSASIAQNKAGELLRERAVPLAPIVVQTPTCVGSVWPRTTKIEKRLRSLIWSMGQVSESSFLCVWSGKCRSDMFACFWVVRLRHAALPTFC